MKKINIIKDIVIPVISGAYLAIVLCFGNRIGFGIGLCLVTLLVFGLPKKRDQL